MNTCLLITTCDRSPLLAGSLTHLLQSNLTRPDEILVVDDGGTDGCWETIQSIGLMWGYMNPRLRYIYTHNPGNSQCSHARNVGIHHTDCDLIVTAEPEIKFGTDVVRQMLDDREWHPNESINAGTVHHLSPSGQLFETTHAWVAPFCAMYDKAWLKAVGGWDEGMPSPWGWEDTDLLTRLRCAGFNQYIDESIEVTHQWHPSRATDQVPNEAHFRAKLSDDGATIRPEFVVANQGNPGWGKPKPR